MPQFWLGTYKLGECLHRSPSMAEPILSDDLETLAIEVIRDGEEYAVLISAADDEAKPQELECRLGFVNGAKACSVWRDRGFPLVDGEIKLENHELTVKSRYFGQDPGPMEYGILLKLTGIRFSGNGKKAWQGPRYCQREIAPDSASPATLVRRQRVTWQPIRSNVAIGPPSKLRIEVTDVRSPSLKPIETGPLHVAFARSGNVDLPGSKSARRQGPLEPADRVDAFGVPAFIFDDVEVIGFRIELPRGRERLLDELVAPLNFHLDEPAGASVPDFRYRVASRTLIVELLRYGKMRLRTQEDPLTDLDYQSQHELVVRMLVGRIDDDASQARDPAVFVPAIFVDNPWSKILGRDVQGFAKCLADFCVGRAALTSEGCDGAGKLQPLTKVSRISLVNRTGGRPPGAGALLDIDTSGRSYIEDEFEERRTSSILGGFSLTEARWQRSSFEELEYLGSFLVTALRQLINGFRSVQSSPVGKQPLPKAWITGKFTVDDLVRVSFPQRPATLKFYDNPKAPAGWKTVCDLLDFRPVHEFHQGRWYRLKFSLNLAIDDGLEWN